ncbi:MAG TPA: hypothetical protein VME42_04855 [Steroidobacteraceae bacterium]|nr:hypothetical protein [Steroidobacteraceae bacterium]
MSPLTNNNAKRSHGRTLEGMALGLAVALAVAIHPAASHAAEKQPSISSNIYKEMKGAQEELQKGQWQEAIKNLDAALQKSGLTTYDKFKIYDFRSYADVKLQKYKDAEADIEAAMATGQYSPEDARTRTKELFQLAAQNGQYAKAVDYGRQLADQGVLSANDLNIMAQLYYLQKDCKNAVIWADKSVAASRKAGEAPKESAFQFKLQCASDTGNMASMEGPLMDLIRLTNKVNYWNTLLRIERQDERDDHNTLMIYRIMYNTQSMKEGSDYIEMAQLLGDAALPEEAVTVLSKAMSLGLIKPEQQERTTRLLNAFQARADADKKQLASEDAEASKSPMGELDVKQGEVYYGLGNYQKAIDLINAGLQKGQIKHLDEAYVYLGLSQAQLKNYADAKKALANLKNVPNISPRVLKLWDLYASTLGMPLVAASS